MIDISGMTVDNRPKLGFVHIRVSRAAQENALLGGTALSSDWKIEVRSKEAAKLALEIAGTEAIRGTDGMIDIDARDIALDALPDLGDAIDALTRLREKGFKKSRR